VLETALSSRCYAHLCDGLNEFIKKAIEFVVFQLRNPAPLDRKTVQMFERILLADDNCNYFMCNHGAVRPSYPDAEGVDGKYMELPEGGASKYYVGSVNAFGTFGGFDLLISRLDQRDPLIPMTEAASYMDVLWVCKFCATKFMIEDTFPRFRRALFDRIKDMTDLELRDVDRNMFGTVMRKLEELLRTVMKRHKGVTTENADETMESMALVIAHRMLVCPYMSLRLKGLSDIKDMLERVEQRTLGGVGTRAAPRGIGVFNAVQVIKPTAWLTPELFVKWIIEFQVLEVSLGERVNDRVFDVHTEALKRLPKIVAFVAEQGQLTVPHVVRLWKIAADSGDSMKRGVFDVLTTAAPHLKKEHFDVLFAAFASVSITDIAGPFLTLITTLTRFALALPVEGEGEQSSYGVNLLWEAVSAPSGLQPDVVVQAEKSFIEMITARPDLVQQYAVRCVKNIQAGVSVVKSLKLVVELLKTLPSVAHHRAAAGEFSTQDAAVRFLLHSFDIASVVVRDLQAYKAAAAEAAGKIGLPIPSPDATGGDAVVVIKPDSHLDAVKARLDFLAFLLSAASSDPDETMISILWQELVLRNITAAEREAFFQWLKAVIDASQTMAAVDGRNFVDDLFDRYMMSSEQLRNASLGPAGFAAFDAAFRVTNVHENKLRTVSTILVTDSELHGIDALWTLAVEALNPDVYKAASELLIALHTKLAPRLMANKRAVWEGFVRTCMEVVQGALAELKTPLPPAAVAQQERRVEAALGLLQKFLSVVEDAGKKSRENYVHPWQVTFTYSDGDQTKTVYLPENPTVGQLRVEAGAKIHFTPDLIRVQSKDRKTYYASEEWDDKFYEATGMPAGTATCMPCTAPMVDTEQFEEARIYPKADLTDPDRSRPRELLSNTQEYFEALFEVLSLQRDSVVSSSWSLIQLLPKNTGIMQSVSDVTTLPTIDWATVLAPAAPLKLLYTLKIVEKYVTPHAKESAEEKATAAAWSAAFVEKGGLAHLLSILQTCDLSTWLLTTLPQSCVTLLLKIVVAFLTPDRYSDGIPALAGVDVPALTGRLFLAVQAAVAAAASSASGKQEEDSEMFEVKDEGALALEKKKGKGKGKGKKDVEGMEDEDPMDITTAGNTTPDEPTEAFETRNLLVSKLAPATKDSQLVQQALSLFGILAFQSEPSRASLSSEPVVQTLLAGLLKVQDTALRVEVEKGLFQTVCGLVLRAGSLQERDQLIGLLTANINTAYDYDGTCTEFFSLLCRLLKLKSDEPPALDASVLLARLVGLIQGHPILEVTVEQEDFLLRGLLSLAAALLSVNPALKTAAESLIHEVFHNCLFAVPTATTPRDSPPPKCKHATSRKTAFALLVELAKDCPPNLALLCEQMVSHHARPAVAISKKGYSLPALPKSSTGYVGLKNLGCICYMNATVQNFFMVPEFRQGVLSFEDTEDDKKESLMFQLQRMFAFLQETDKQCYNPKGFCHAFKDWDGNPTNVYVQKDASEFLGLLFQMMEMKLQGSPQEHVLKQCFGGTHQNELIADGKYSAREEPFTYLSLEIKNKKDLASALRALISHEMVDYKWENEDGSKVELPTQKRTSIKTPPQHLILHLKRFEFDYETMQNSKLNDRFEFPRELDLWEFSAAGRPDKVVRPEAKEGEGKEEEAVLAVPEDRDDFKYELAGVVIHSGTANAGHYYSFIRERLGGKLGRWMMFNDSSVTPFNPDFLEREAFGGVETYKYAYTGLTQQQAITRNAFVLFYDRVPKGAVPEAAAAAAEPTLPDAADLSLKLLARHRAKASHAPSAPIPPEIYEAITADNIGFWRERNIYDKTYFSFLSTLLQYDPAAPSTAEPVPYPSLPVTSLEDASAQGGPSFRVIRLSTLFVLNTLATSTHKAQWKTWLAKLEGLYRSNAVACVWLLQTLISDDSLLKRLLFEVEDGIASLLAFVVTSVLTAESPLPAPGEVKAVVVKRPPPLVRAGSGDIDIEAKTEAPPEVFQAPHGRVAVTFIESLLALLPVAAAQWLKFGQYFSLFNAIASTSEAALVYLKQRGLISILIGFFLDGESPLPQFNVLPASDAGESAAAATTVTIGPVNKPSHVEDLDGIRVTGSNYVGFGGNYAGATYTSTSAKSTKMGSAYYSPDFAPVLNCLKALLLSSVPPSGVPARGQLPPGDVLSLTDLDMTSSDQFLTKLLSGAAGISIVVARQLINHIVFNNASLSARIATMIQQGITAADGDAIQPWFKATAELFAIADDLQEARVGMLLQGIATAMQSQQAYYKATEVSIIQFVQLAKHNEQVRRWMYANAASLAWMVDWLRTNTKPPLYYQAGLIKLNKATTTYVYSQAEGPVRTPALVERLAALLRGLTVSFTDLDPLDDPLAIIGKRIAVEYPSRRWYAGRVELYDPASGKHKVKFDDNDEVQYDLMNKGVTYKFVKETIVLNSAYPPLATDEVPFTVIVPGVAPGAAAAGLAVPPPPPVQEDVEEEDKFDDDADDPVDNASTEEDEPMQHH